VFHSCRNFWYSRTAKVTTSLFRILHLCQVSLAQCFPARDTVGSAIRLHIIVLYQHSTELQTTFISCSTSRVEFLGPVNCNFHLNTGQREIIIVISMLNNLGMNIPRYVWCSQLELRFTPIYLFGRKWVHRNEVNRSYSTTDQIQNWIIFCKTSSLLKLHQTDIKLRLLLIIPCFTFETVPRCDS
jgi:hypothetical protein